MSVLTPSPYNAGELELQRVNCACLLSACMLGALHWPFLFHAYTA
jgi:hypothetical protein